MKTSGVPIDDGTDDELLAAFVGPGWNEHYRDSFAALRTGIRNVGDTFNSAALAPLWLAYRGFLILQLVSFIAFIALWVAGMVLAVAVTHDVAAAAAAGLIPLALAYAVVGAAEGLVGDKLLYRRAVAVTSRLRLRGLNRDALLAAARKAGGVSVAGAVLAPLILVLFGMLLVPMLTHRLFHNHEPAYLAAMKSDLRNLVTAQESYFDDFSTFAGTLRVDATSPYDSSQVPNFTPSTGVTIVVGVATATGWNATARHAAALTVCGIFIGTAPPPIKDAGEGEPKCLVGSRL